MAQQRKPGPSLNARPETLARQADGCHVHPTCLTCPLDLCIFDQPQPRPAVQAQVRQDAEAILQAYQERRSLAQVAKQFGVSQTTIWRIVQGRR